MHRPAICLLALVAGLPLAAQGILERNPNPGAQVQRVADDVHAKKGFEAANRSLSPKYRALLEAFSPESENDLRIEWGEFLTAEGVPFIAFHLALPDTIDASSHKLTLFGIVKAGEKELASFQEEATISGDGERWLQKSLVIPLLHATATFGVARGSTVVAMGRIDLAPEELRKEVAGISRIITSANVYNLGASQSPLEPFAFGGTKVVPKRNATFRRNEPPWVFVELRNPALGSDGTPKIMTRLQLEGPATISGPPVIADAAPLKGLPGHYGIGNTIPVERLQPGEYRLKLTVIDTIARQTFKRESILRITE